ncbi:MAG: hypothetical protein IJ237_09050 [Oscillospiraceae bacterium]|nr:hypothetical protein [Oscillospiraceae bacterium]
MKNVETSSFFFRHIMLQYYEYFWGIQTKYSLAEESRKSGADVEPVPEMKK